MSLNVGGSDKNTTSNQVSNPWAPTQGLLEQLLGQMGGANTSVTGAQNNAFAQLEANAANGDPNSAATRALSTSLLNSQSQNGTIDNAYKTLQGNLGGIASQDVDPTKDPGMQGLLATIRSDVGNSVNGQFAAAGRDGSGMNSQNLARGISQGESGALLNQYNQNVQNKTAASNALYGAGSNTATTDQSLNDQLAQEKMMGVAMGDKALQEQNYGANSILNLEQQKTSLPFQNMGLLAQLLYGMAGLGGQVSGTSNTTGSNWGLGGNLLSDERAKEDIAPVGKMDDGTTIYKYKYKGDPVTHVGPMAQEVEQRTPEAVDNNGPGGLKTVNMDLATRKAAQIAQARLQARKGRAA